MSDHALPPRSDPPDASGPASAAADTPAAAPSESCAAGDGAPALPFTIVGIGASAGGLEAIRNLLGAMPEHPGMAFVVVMHLDPARDSALASLLQAVTRMPVAQATDGTVPEPDHVYVIPAGWLLSIEGGRLRLEPLVPRGQGPMAFDRFLAALAREQKERAICIVLSGLDGDGSAGLEAIKSEGGMVIAQSPATAAHPGMPDSAVATGLVDQVLAVEDMPEALVAYARHAELVGEASAPDGDETVLLGEALSLLRQRTGLDFRNYKRGMLLRRVRRRIGLVGAAGMRDYVERLRDDVPEATALADDMLIGVTSFFREPEAWGALEREVLPGLLAGKSPESPVRVWVPACSTGEEAYTLAMLVLERLEGAGRGTQVHVFATDVDRAALDVARRGVYPETIANVVSPERLQRFFQSVPGGYQVRKALREAVVFAPQNVISDPPFSRLDIVSCRNLMIYLEPALQQKLLEVFHFALNPGGVLLLGKSEVIGHRDGLFEPAVAGPVHIFRSIGADRRRPMSLPLGAGGHPGLDGHRPVQAEPRREPAYGDLTREALLELHAPAAVLVNRRLEALYFHGPTDAYLALPRGRPTSDVLQLVRESLRPMLRAALHGAVTEGRRIELTAADDAMQHVAITAVPLPDRGVDGLALVTFQRMPLAPGAVGGARFGDADSGLVDRLEAQIKAMRRELQGVIEELETANEELKVSNEEALSMNEELQSTHEELETSKEELQSVNEELVTVNQQLSEKLAELGAANDDLSNLLTSSHIPTLFLDRRLNIKRFTPAATRLFSLIASDIDRPITDIAGRFDIGSLLEDARRVLETLAPTECEMRADTGEYFLRRTLPYRTRDDRIDGVVVTFVDVSDLRRATDDLRKLAAVLRISSDAIVVHELDGRIVTWNAGAEKMYGWSEAEALRMNVSALVPASERAGQAALVARVRAGETVQAHPARRLTRDGRAIDVAVTLSVLEDGQDRPSAIAAIERDVTEHLRVEHELREREARFRSLADSAPVMIWMADADGRIDFVNRNFSEWTGRRTELLLGMRWHELVPPDELPAASEAFRDALRRRGRVEVLFRLQSADGSYRWTRTIGVPRFDAEGGLEGYVGITVDVHEQQLAETTLREADRRKDEFLAMLGHELRNPLVPIRNAVEVLRLLDRVDPRLAWISRTLARQTDHLRRLVDDLLDVSRVARGTITLHLEPVDIAVALRRAIESIDDHVRERGQRLVVSPMPESLWVDADPVRLVQMVDNLLTNASKYSGKGKEIRLEAALVDGWAELRVSDEGIGIAPEALPHVFDMFVQEQRALDRSQGGLGIGLALVRQLAELHGGSIVATSEGVGRGAQFTLRLPALRREPAPPPEPAPLPVDPAEGQRILVVDDDPDAADSTAMLLRMHGFEVRTAGSVASALAEARAFAPRVVIMDIGLPDGNGYDAARRMRAIGAIPSPALVAVSGFAQPGNFGSSRAEGFVAHLTKPVDADTLLQSIARAMQSGEPRV